MQVTNLNNVKIYNLSSGKSLPEWLDERKRRLLLKKDTDLRRRIQLIQDFEMPTVSNCVAMSDDENYIFATGVYKPRVRCFDVHQMSMKFERCMDSEVLKFQLLSSDYSKIVFLQIDRFIEFHAQHGRYYRTRIPFYGRDFTFLHSNSNLYFVGASREVCRLNLELGQFMSPLTTQATDLNCCCLNEKLELFTCGTSHGIVECWDPRARNCVGRLDCAAHLVANDNNSRGELPSVTAISFSGATIMGVGSSTGQVLVYEIRMNKPMTIKDHNFNLPIKNVKFHKSMDTDENLVLSIDKRILKIWNQDTGKAFTSVEPESSLNDLCLVRDSGLIFMANEAPKILTYYIPELGQAPKWCSMLTSITEELEENTSQVYDDYKFLTRSELDDLGLSHLIGSNLLRAEMHGYYIRMELYQKAKSLVEPLKYSDYQKKKNLIVSESESRIKQTSTLPKVNKMMAEKLEAASKKKPSKAKNLLLEGRFSKMFLDKDFEIDITSEHYQRLVPVMPKVNLGSTNQDQDNEDNNNEDRIKSDDGNDTEDNNDDDDSSSSDDENVREQMRKQHKLIKEQKYQKELKERNNLKNKESKATFQEISSTAKLQTGDTKRLLQMTRKPFSKRLEESSENYESKVSGNKFGEMEMTFQLKNKKSKLTSWKQKSAEHHKERKKIRRPAGKLHSSKSE